jgi:hypothetical protein
MTSLVQIISNLKKNFLNKKVTVLFCDIQGSYTSKMYLYEDMLKGAYNLADITTNLGLNAYITEHVPKVFGKTDSKLIELLKNPVIVEKYFFSMLNDETIANLYPDDHSFILVGMETHICVFQTAYTLLKNKKDVIIIKDAVSSNSKEERETGLKNIESMGAFITTNQNLLYLLLENGKHECFKSCLPIMKRMIDDKNQLI